MTLKFEFLTIIFLTGLCIFLLFLLLSDKKKMHSLGMNEFDFLTKALSRSSLIRDLSTAKDVFVFFCDLDNFKKVNDMFGHKAGDEVLIKTVKAWQNVQSKSSYKLYRNGGDEFVFILKTTKNDEAIDFAKKVIKAVKSIKEEYFSYVSVSVGFVSDKYGNGSDLLSFADNAMYIAKESGKNTYTEFNDELKRQSDEENSYKLILDNILSGQIDFEMYYQPQISLKRNQIIGAEALLRARSNGKFINTQKLVNIAEQDSKILKLDSSILSIVLRDVQSFFDIKNDLTVSVNFSGKHVSIENFSEDVYDNLDKNMIKPKNFEIEITEESYVKGLKSAVSNIDRLKRLGIKIALDDFGSGFSSLKYLSKFKFNVLKIDKSFIDDIDNNIKILSLIVDIGHSLNAQIVAEGVENEHQLDILKSINCDIVQGFYFYKPMSSRDFKNLLLTKNI